MAHVVKGLICSSSSGGYPGPASLSVHKCGIKPLLFQTLIRAKWSKWLSHSTISMGPIVKNDYNYIRVNEFISK